MFILLRMELSLMLITSSEGYLNESIGFGARLRYQIMKR